MHHLTPETIGNSRALVDAMGRWPGFHDAHVRQVIASEGNLYVIVHVFHRTDEVDAAGYFVLTKHHLVELDLLAVSASTLPAGYRGDILDSLTARRCDAGVDVQFESVVGSEFGWQAVCAEVRIRGVTPCDPRGNRPDRRSTS